MMTGDVWFWFLAGLATLLVGSSKGGLPLVGMLAVPLVALQISPVVAAGLLLPIYIVSDVYGLWLYRKSYDLRNIEIIVPAAAIGIALGWATVSITSDDLVKMLVGIIGLVYCADVVLKARRAIAPGLRICRAAFSGGQFRASQVSCPTQVLRLIRCSIIRRATASRFLKRQVRLPARHSWRKSPSGKKFAKRG